MSRLHQRWKSFVKGYSAFVEKQGFPLIVTLCIAIIVFTAAWTHQPDELPPAPTSPALDDGAYAAQLQQQMLKDAATPSPAPTPDAPAWLPPFDEVIVLRSFDATRVLRSGVSGMWQIHDAVDLQAEQGARVQAISAGTVLSVSEDDLIGVCVMIEHADGYVSQYAGMAAAGAVQAGDHVSQGQTVGFAGNGMLDESDLPPHVHLRVTKSGQAVDPLTLWKADRE